MFILYRTDLERRFEEYRYRLSCALETIHEYEDEISKLKSRVAELETKISNQSDTEKELEQFRDYAEQLQEQFAAQVDIIDVLKHKIVQVCSSLSQIIFILLSCICLALPRGLLVFRFASSQNCFG